MASEAVTPNEAAARAAVMVRDVLSRDGDGDGDGAAALLRAIRAETGREGTTVAVGALCDVIIAAEGGKPEEAGGEAPELPPDWERCWLGWALEARRAGDERQLGRIVAANPPGLPTEARCLSLLLAEASAARDRLFTRVTGQTSGMLRAALRDDWDGALETAHAISSESGRDGMFLMLTALADWAVQAQCLAAGREMPEAGSPGRPAWRDPDSGTLTLNAREVSPAEAWGGQFLAARAAMDHDTTLALFESLPDECGKYVRLMVASCAESVKLARSAS